MPEALYCDTCVYRDCYEWRSGIAFLHYGEEAKKLFGRIKNGEFRLVVSDHLDFQLKGFKEYEVFKKEMKQANNLIEVRTEKEDKARASAFSQQHPQTEYEDSLHVELALKAGATIVTTWNIEHFAPHQHRLKIRTPPNVGLF